MVHAAGAGDGGYRLVCNIAKGGMGRVELVLRQEADFARLYARKRLLASLTDDEESRAMFRDEARIAGMLRHPNLVGVYDVGEDDEGLFLIMDYVEGVPLTRLVERARALGEPVPIQHCLTVMMQVAEGLHAAHELKDLDGQSLGLVHRDVSPSNILVELNGVVRVADFGIARAVGRRAKTSTGLLKGKVGYMAPELLRFQRPDRRADLYSFGVVLYELVASRRLYKGEDLTDVAMQILEGAPPDLGADRNDVPDGLVELCFELLSKLPELRPPTAKDVAHRLEGVMQELLMLEDPLSFEDYLRAQVDTRPIAERRERVKDVRRGLVVAEESPGAPRDDVLGALGRTDGALPFATADRPRSGRGLWLAASAVALLGVGSALGFVFSRGSATPTSAAETDAPAVSPETMASSGAPPNTTALVSDAAPEGRALHDGVDEAVSGTVGDTPQGRVATMAGARRRAAGRAGRMAQPAAGSQTSAMDTSLEPWGWE